MRRFHLLLLLALASCGSQDGNAPRQAEKVAGQAPSTPRVGVDRSHAGTAAPDAGFQDPDGAPASLADFRGKPLLLNLWATWCAPCIKELPTLDALAAREAEKLQVVTLSQDTDGRDKVETFLAGRKLPNLEAWLDPEMKMMTALGVATLPTTILYDADGKEVWRFTGDEDWTGVEAAKLIGEASGGGGEAR
ncbi:TlpA family protein disulfide reductase [Sphingomonas parva]|nr:TlpA disulfide reductase family protein [Sphingomonas parva]